MTTSVPKVLPDDRYGVVESAKILGIHRNTLRAYTNEGLIKCGHRTKTRKRFYTGSELIRFWKSYS